ncbi:endo-1,4-beta-xylanase [Thalassotalea fonticola]|uniref:endo-1,4-beta-xylanase n=1 Tax=Thalassotalea fonticola TaxID=3065649 RepID=A0ABZ0GVI2_9GAMM|nr:endo-1,4-beta-xylanase [Colwelliaceae bacterium S1-1]
MKQFIFIIKFIAIFLCISVKAVTLPAGGVEAKYQPELLKLKRKNEFSEITTVSLDNQKYKQVLDVQVHKPSTKIWQVQVPFTLSSPNIEFADTIMVKVVARSLSSHIADGSVGQMDLYFKYKQRGKPVVNKRLMLSKQWQTFYIPVKVDKQPKVADMQLVFLLGGLPKQHLQIAELSIINYKDSIDVAILPMTKVKYFGMEDDAPWRNEAEQRIEKYRKADFNLNLFDKNQQPIRAAKIDINLQRHDYNFGCGLKALEIFGKNRLSEQEKQQQLSDIEKMCNLVVFNNALKWRHFNADAVEKAMDWAKKRDLKVRGHALIWGRFRSAHKEIEKKQDYYKKHPEEFQKVLLEHVKEFAALYPDQISDWDVINEPSPEHHFVDILGKEATIEWLNAAKEANPNAARCANDYGIVSRYDTWHQDAYYDWMKYFTEQNAIDKVCVQGHFQGPMPITEFYQRLERFAEFNLPITMTEFDFFEIDQQLKAKFMEDLITAFFSHPNTDGFIHWNLTDLYDENGKLNLSGKAYDKLIHKTWHTKVALKTDEQGQASFNGFKGQYNLKIELANGKTMNKLVKLSNSDVVSLTLN